MSEINTWMALRSAMQADGAPRRRIERSTVRRIGEFARPHRRTIVGFLVLATVSAVLGVASPVLAGRAVDAIVEDGETRTVVLLAVAIGLVALLGAGVGLLERLQSSRLGEGLILDLRRRVFEHVQTMPVAFFTRTHTGALVSRLNSDVIGAQRAFTSALAGVVTNLIAVVLTLAVMVRLSWLVTLLALVMLPLFLVPARRVGARVGALEREAAGHNAAMTTQMTERFSAPGATLVKLFGRPRREADEFGARAGRVRDIGVRSAMASQVFITLHDVRFSYPTAERISLASLESVAVLDDRPSHEVLRGISFRVEPGQMVALVGASGGGKSTIASLVPRLYDVDSGAVRLGGVDVRDLPSAAIRGAVGMVTQDGHLFHDTVRANLLYARPDATEADLHDALAKARLAELVGSLPDGIDTVVGERGYRFSGGERQRLTIARVLLARPRVVVLDEATSSLDATSEAAVQEALAVALEGRTALVIAHRLSTVRAADRILVVDDGRIVESGTHAELLARSGRYAELHRTQFADDSGCDEARLDGEAVVA